ncbi:MAG: hypothetical protein HZA91_17880 [Verrucomicrobia bacterium]|nr:hypothetical protein [Verrucomicrobiota bacterium]
MRNIAGRATLPAMTALRPGLALIALALPVIMAAESGPEPLAAWRDGVKIAPVSTAAGRHTIHSYVNTCPESPDDRWVLFFASTTADAHRGELRILERSTGQEKVLARDINTAVRAAKVSLTVAGCIVSCAPCWKWIRREGRRMRRENRNTNQKMNAVMNNDTGRYPLPTSSSDLRA